MTTRTKRAAPSGEKKPSLEERVAALEKQVAKLTHQFQSTNGEKGKTDWRASLNLFPPNDPIMKEIHEEARKIREADRKRARKK